MAAAARDLKNDDTTDAGFDLFMYPITSPVAGDMGATRIDVGTTGTTAVPMDSSNPLYAQLTTGSAVIGEVTVGAATAAAGDLAKAEDAAHSSGDIGVMSLTVRQNTAAATSGADGDYQPLITDTNGRLHVIDVGIQAALSGNELQVDVVSGTITTVSTVTNLSQMGGVAISLNTGVRDTGTQRVTIATNDLVPVTGTLTAVTSITNTVAVSGAVTANLSATDNAVLDTIDGVLDTINAKLVTGTVIGDVNVAASLPAGTNAIGKLAANSGVDIGDVDILSIAAGDNNIGNVDIASGTITTVSTVTNLSQMGGVAISLNTGVRDAGTQRVTIATNDSVPITGTITASLSATDNAVLDTIDAVLDTINAKLVTGTVIGDVNLGATDNAVLDDIAAKTSDPTKFTHDAAGGTAVGNMMMAQRDDEVGSTATTSADGDAQALTANKFGQLKTTGIADATSEVKYFVINAASGDNTLVAAAGSGIKIRVINIVLIAGGTTTCRLESGAGGTALTGIMQLTSQVGFAPGECLTGHFETADNALLNLECTGDIDGWGSYVEV